MDENTGEVKVITQQDIAREIQRAKAEDIAKGIKFHDPRKMNADDFMRKFMPQMIPVKRLPKKNCKICHGSGNLGRNVLTNKFVPCPCTR